MTSSIGNNTNSTHFTQPAECANSSDAVPAMASNVQYYNQVPLYQTRYEGGVAVLLFEFGVDH
ncbi:unnamed protein product [Penicillium discolor]